METIKNKIPEHYNIFFKELSEYLNTTLYFYGSVQRNDYFVGSSDVDVDIFTDNEQSTMSKLQYFLNKPKKKFKKIVWKSNYSNRIIHGHKIYFENEELDITAEFSIYNELSKDDVLNNHREKTQIPFYASWMLIVIKILYYKLHILSKAIFNYLKNKILSTCIGIPDTTFIIFRPEEYS
jgi:hypothetical protein